MVGIAREELLPGETMQEGYKRKEREHREAHKEEIAESPFAGMSEEESIAFQLRCWAEGNSVHNLLRDECCPDFSCCFPEMSTPLEVRKSFVGASPEVRHEMLGMFLGQAAQKWFGEKDPKVYIAGMDPGGMEQ